MSNLCAYCERPAVTEADGEPMCQDHFDEWWHDNSFTCVQCGNDFADDELVKIHGDCFCRNCSPETLADKADFDRKDRACDAWGEAA